MFGYSRIDSGRFSLRERKFFRLAFIENRDRQTVQKLMGLGTTQYYKYYNKVSEYLNKDFRRYSIRNPHSKTPERMLAKPEVEEQPVKQEDIQELEQLSHIQKKYVEVTGKELPNRYKNNAERLLSKINDNA